MPWLTRLYTSRNHSPPIESVLLHRQLHHRVAKDADTVTIRNLCLLCWCWHGMAWWPQEICVCYVDACMVTTIGDMISLLMLWKFTSACNSLGLYTSPTHQCQVEPMLLHHPLDHRAVMNVDMVTTSKLCLLCWCLHGNHNRRHDKLANSMIVYECHD